MSDDSSSDVRAVRLPRLASSRLCIMHLSTRWAVRPLLALRICIGSHTPLETGCRSPSASTRINEALLIFITPSPPLAYLGTSPAEIAARCSLSSWDAHPSSQNTPPNTKHTNTDTSTTCTGLRSRAERPLRTTTAPSAHQGGDHSVGDIPELRSAPLTGPPRPGATHPMDVGLPVDAGTARRSRWTLDTRYARCLDEEQSGRAAQRDVGRCGDESMRDLSS
ncbi:hypothetical protein B0H14DRAFT_3458815 [Mycena olivaceomarginata]|nr:hypothetical protein B0H14DRAFT_3458815 [Mycena olivaceomarginata]